MWFCQCFAPSSDRSDDDLLVSLSLALVRHDAVWILGNLRLSGHQHEGGRILRLVDVVNDVLFVLQWRVQRDVRLSTQMSFRYCLESDGRSPKRRQRHIVVLCFIA